MKNPVQINKETLAFFKQIEKNNNKPWFEKNKPTYEIVTENYLAFIEYLLILIRKIEPIHEKDLKNMRVVFIEIFVFQKIKVLTKTTLVD